MKLLRWRTRRSTNLLGGTFQETADSLEQDLLQRRVASFNSFSTLMAMAALATDRLLSPQFASNRQARYLASGVGACSASFEPHRHDRKSTTVVSPARIDSIDALKPTNPLTGDALIVSTITLISRDGWLNPLSFFSQFCNSARIAARPSWMRHHLPRF